mgnify:CR=1 FL=1
MHWNTVWRLSYVEWYQNTEKEKVSLQYLMISVHICSVWLCLLTRLRELQVRLSPNYLSSYLLITVLIKKPPDFEILAINGVGHPLELSLYMIIYTQINLAYLYNGSLLWYICHLLYISKWRTNKSSWLEHSNTHTDKNTSLLVQQYI